VPSGSTLTGYSDAMLPLRDRDITTFRVLEALKQVLEFNSVKSVELEIITEFSPVMHAKKLCEQLKFLLTNVGL